MKTKSEEQDVLLQAIKESRKKNLNYVSYDETDTFTLNGMPVLSVLDFWRFCYGALAGQSPMIAEFLVAKALGIEKAENVMVWTAYDMTYRNMRIEVKSTEFVHPWNEETISKVRVFSIAPSYDSSWSNDESKKLSRQNDIYVFCLNTNKEVQNPKPLILDFWEFYVVPTNVINQYTKENKNPDQKKISLSIIKKLSGKPVKWNKLKEKIDEVIDIIL